MTDRASLGLARLRSAGFLGRARRASSTGRDRSDLSHCVTHRGRHAWQPPPGGDFASVHCTSSPASYPIFHHATRSVPTVGFPYRRPVEDDSRTSRCCSQPCGETSRSARHDISTAFHPCNDSRPFPPVLTARWLKIVFISPQNAGCDLCPDRAHRPAKAGSHLGGR